MLNHLIERLAATRARQASWPAFAQRLQAHGQRLLDEPLETPALATWWCGEDAALREVLPLIKSSVIKPTYPYNTDRQSFEPVLGHSLSRQEQNEWAGRILRDPDATSHVKIH